LGTENVL